MNDDTRSLSEQAASTDTPFRPDNTPRQCKIMPKERKSTRGTKGAFGKARNKPKGYDLMNFLTLHAKKLEAQLKITGQISEPTRDAIDKVFGAGATATMAKAIINKIEKEAA